jgi:hypothetical protein
MITPLQLEILICAHTGEPKLNKHFRDLQVWVDQAQELVNEGILLFRKDTTMCTFQLSEKGQFYFNYICAVPFPSIEYKINWE